MIKVKNRPATPLPFRLFLRPTGRTTTIEVSGPEPMKLGERPCVVGWAGFDSTDLDPEDNVLNASYLIHAANAYPKLIDILRRHVRYRDTRSAAAALLRELGEKR